MSIKKVYLACPYTSRSLDTRNNREYLATRVAARLMSEGVCVYSPITHGHRIAEHLHRDFVENHSFWMDQCLPILEACDALVVLTVEGWRTSKGVHLEIQRAKELAMPIFIYQAGFTELLDEEEFELLGYREYNAKEIQSGN